MPPRPTHFLSFSLGDNRIIRQNARGLYDCWARYSFDDYDATIITEPQRLHLTLGVLRLDPSTYPLAADTLRLAANRVKRILNGQDLSVTLGQLGTFQQDLSKTHVVFISPIEPPSISLLPNSSLQTLHQVCDCIRNTFQEANLLQDNMRPLQLHCTLLNTSNRRPRSKTRQPFNLEQLLLSSGYPNSSSSSMSSSSSSSNRSPPFSLEAYSSKVMIQHPIMNSLTDWGTTLIDEVQICEMGSRDLNGQYVAVSRESIII